MTCTITKNLEIVPGTRADYQSLSQYHYRQCNLGPYAAIFALKGKFRTAEKLETAGVIVYAMPTAGLQMRSEAIPFLAGLDRSTRMSILNKNVRTISRCIIEPRFRSLGLAARLVRETMPLITVPFVEALAVMGQVNPFFEKAGMTRYDAPSAVGFADGETSPDSRTSRGGPACVRLLEAFGAVGIEQQDLIDPQLVQQKLNSMLDTERSGVPIFGTRSSMLDFIEGEMARFLQSYGQRRLMQPGIERTEFVLSKLTDRPVYYLWQNPNIELRI